MKLDGLHLSLIANGNQKSNAKVRAGFIRLNKTPGSLIFYLCSWRFFRLEGREKNAWRRAPCLLWDILPSCGNSLIGLKLWAVPPWEPGPANGRENRSWTRAWPLYMFLCGLAGAGTVSVRAQEPGASQPLPVHRWLSLPCAAAVSWMSWLTPPRRGGRPLFPFRSFSLQARVLETLVPLHCISDSGSLGYSALASPLRAVTPVTVGPDRTTQGDQEAWTPKGRFSRQTSPSSPRGSKSSPHSGDWGPAPLLPVAGLPGSPGGLRAPRPPCSQAKPRTRLSAGPARPQRKRETGQAWVQVLLVLRGSDPPPRLGLARKSSSQLGPGQTVSARWQYCPRTTEEPCSNDCAPALPVWKNTVNRQRP